ncbi:MAG: FeoB-associated Cys-rich membrane protein [Flavobacteriales bacterium]
MLSYTALIAALGFLIRKFFFKKSSGTGCSGNCCGKEKGG